jgi:hypothetical protein
MPDLPIDPSAVAIAGIPIILLIIGLIESLKRSFPRAPGNVWFGVASLLGVLLFSLAHIADHGSPTTLAAWLNLVVVGLAFGLAAGQIYERFVKKQPAPTVGASDSASTFILGQPREGITDADVAMYVRQQEQSQRIREREATEARLAEVMRAVVEPYGDESAE